ncbi:MAG TPA: type II CAAX endopeptidase family protein [Gemmatimonadales bacterium]|nr:type II CAAX endopeptidase family protein [Gemmatimonadales bacterium]
MPVATGEALGRTSPEALITATTSEPPEPLPSDGLPERTAAIGLFVPVLLVVALPALSGLDGSSGPIAFTDARLGSALVVQLALVATLGLWLWRRGWRPHRTATRPISWLDLWRGLVLWAGAILAVACWAVVCRALLPDVFSVARQTQISGAPHFWTVIPYTLTNAVFEEFLWLGLGFAAFRRLGVVGAGAISAVLRVAAHAYQGPLALVTIVPIAIVFTVYYGRTQRVWPIVVAHAFQDLLALGLLARMSGDAAV